jgi:hypothetical protein
VSKVAASRSTTSPRQVDVGMVLPLNLDDYGSTLVSFICYASCFCISWILLLVVLIVVPLAMIREKKGNDGQLLEQRHFGGLVGMSPVNPQLASL